MGCICVLYCIDFLVLRCAHTHLVSILPTDTIPDILFHLSWTLLCIHLLLFERAPCLAVSDISDDDLRRVDLTCFRHSQPPHFIPYHIVDMVYR
jgi:hypothetical protein